MIKKKNRIAMILIAITVLVFGCSKKTSGLKPSDIQPIVAIFLSRHVHHHNLNDDISYKTLENLIDYLDPGKYYFYNSDIQNFLKHKYEIDDFIKTGNYDFLFEIQKIYKTRVYENMKLFDELIDKKYDFNKDESIVIERDKLDYSKTEDEMRERWRKNIKLQLLNQLTVIKDIEKAKNKIIKKHSLINKRVEEIDQEKMISIFINAFSTGLDPHSNYLTQEEHEDFMISTKLKLEGIGVLLRTEDGFVTVESIIPGGAAAKLPDEIKLKPNDKIVAVAQDNEDPVDVIDMALRDVVKLIRGKKGTIVKLTIIREIEEKTESPRLLIPITREEINLKDRAAKSEVLPVKKRTSSIRIGYIKLPSFYMDFDAMHSNDSNATSSSKDLIIQINKLKNKGIAGLILDFRGNPGGALKESVDIAGMFIDHGPVVQVLAGRDRVETMSDNDPGVYYDGPIVILIDKFSASASEIFAGAIKDYKRGIIIGSSNTFGKGTVQTYNVLPGGNGAMKITTAIFYQPGGSSNQLYGISPDIIVPDLSSIWEIGEEKLNNPLQWKKIKKSEFVSYKKYLNNKVISDLRKLSSKRIKSDKKFIELKEKLNKLKKKQDDKTISLKEEVSIENQKKEDMKRKREKEHVENKLIDFENDIFLKEAFNIAADYIEMLK